MKIYGKENIYEVNKDKILFTELNRETCDLTIVFEGGVKLVIPEFHEYDPDKRV